MCSSQCETTEASVNNCPSCGGPLNPSARPDYMYNLRFTYCHDCWVESRKIKSLSISTILFALETSRREHYPHLQEAMPF